MLELKEAKTDVELASVKRLLDRIENISSDSFMSDKDRTIPSVYYLAIEVDSLKKVGVVETFFESLGCSLSFNNFGIIKECRGIGYGAEFINQLGVQASKRGFNKLKLTSHPSAVDFYKKCSFTLDKNSDVSFTKNLIR